LEQYHYIKTRTEGRVFYLTLARPDKRNAFTPTMVSEVAHALNVAQNDKNSWLVVFEAEGSVFCAGMDLNVFQNPDLDIKNEAIPNTHLSLGQVVGAINKPTIALVEGPVIAGGFLIIAECTFVVANQKATFSLPEVKRGIFPMQVMNSLSKIMPQRKILEMCILGKTYTAPEAAEMGIVTHYFEENTFKIESKSLLDSILDAAPLAVSKGLEALKNLPSMPESEKYQFLKTKIEKLKNTDDAQEGINAFREKRKPVWKNS
jgi:enoyl-CoA hydratase/carnithine racemase